MQAELSLRDVELHEKDEEMDEMDIGVLIRKSPKWFQSKKKKKKEHTIKFVIFQWVYVQNLI